MPVRIDDAQLLDAEAQRVGMQAEALDFYAGVFILGGLIFLPLLYGLVWLHLGYLEALPWSILSCFVFLIAFGPDVEFSWLRTIPAIAAGAVLVWLYQFGAGRPAYDTKAELGIGSHGARRAA